MGIGVYVEQALPTLKFSVSELSLEEPTKIVAAADADGICKVISYAGDGLVNVRLVLNQISYIKI